MRGGAVEEEFGPSWEELMRPRSEEPGEGEDPLAKRQRLAALYMMDAESYEFNKLADVAYELGEDKSMPEHMIKAAKQAEIQSLEDLGVYKVVPVHEAESDPEGIWVDARWVVTNKGSQEAPVAKCRFVAREFATDKRTDLYAGTLGSPTSRC